MEDKRTKLSLPERIEFTTEYDPAYRVVGCNGIFGGLTPRGDLKLDFFEEYQAIPDRMTNKVTPEGVIGEEIERVPPMHTVRMMRVSILMPPSQIPAMIEWLQDKRQFLERFKELLEGKEDSHG
jgi:hypothetical protein